MSTEKLELVSALADDELDNGAPFVLRSLLDDAGSRKAWGRYHLMGECLRGHLSDPVDVRLADRIFAALQDEPLLQSVPGRSRLQRAAAGFAIAASVAAIAILGVRQMETVPGNVTAPSLASHQAEQNPGPSYQTVTVTADNPVATLPVVTTASPDDTRSRLNRYLVNYNEYRARSGVQGTMPYARIVTHEIEE